jgi:hypothetical protein
MMAFMDFLAGGGSGAAPEPAEFLNGTGSAHYSVLRPARNRRLPFRKPLEPRILRLCC